MRQVIDQYKIDKLLGEGGFGKVWRGTHKKTKEVVAIKTIDISESYKSADLIQQIYKEAKILKQLSHRNIIKLYQAFEIRKDLHLIMEYAGGGELSDMVKELGGLTEIETRNIIMQVALAMQVCHNKGVIHRDLKLENVLFDSPARNKIKIVDFGIAGIVTSVQSDKNTAATLKYMTPEMISQTNSVASPAMDVWAIGIMTYCMLFNRLPFSSPNKDEIKNLILTQPYRLSKSKPVTAACQQFLASCLEKKPEDRITIKAMLELPWLTKSEEQLEDDIKAMIENINNAEEVKLSQNEFSDGKKPKALSQSSGAKQLQIAAPNRRYSAIIGAQKIQPQKVAETPKPNNNSLVKRKTIKHATSFELDGPDSKLKPGKETNAQQI